MADKIIETEPRRARKRDADGNARLVLKETTLAFGKSQVLVFVGNVVVLEIEHCESQTLVLGGKLMHCESQGLGFSGKGLHCESQTLTFLGE